MFPNYPKPVESGQVSQAKRILAWCDQNLIHQLPEESLRTYRAARQEVGERATTTRARHWPGGPAIRGPRMQMDGAGDDVFGPHRVRAIIQKVIIPLIEIDQLDVRPTIDLLQQLRGEFADQYRIVERAHHVRVHNNKGRQANEEKAD